MLTFIKAVKVTKLCMDKLYNCTISPSHALAKAIFKLCTCSAVHKFIYNNALIQPSGTEGVRPRGWMW